MKISKKVREEAARLCSAMASIRAERDASIRTEVIPVWPHNKKKHRAAEVAWLAFDNAWDTLPYSGGLHERWAEAEALLRTGWGPK